MTTPAVPEDYAKVLAGLKAEVRSAQERARRAVTAELLGLYWRIGSTILAQQQLHGWGAKVIDRLAADLRSEFPTMRGLSRSNLKYMRQFAAAYPDLGDRDVIGQRSVGQLGWGHVITLLSKCKTPAERDWYADKAAAEGWTRDVLEAQIAWCTHARVGAAPSNFADRLPAVDAEMMQQFTKDPYVFDFLDLSEKKVERDVEQALMDRLQDTLLEFGRGFSFVGRQVSFDVDGEEYRVDLLLFHVEAVAYVVVELKVGKFQPAHAGQLGTYVAMVDDKLRNPAVHAPTVGILLCASRSEAAVRYALSTNTAPLAVANFTDVPGLEKLQLPEPAELTAILEAPFDADHTLAEALPEDARTEQHAAGEVLDTLEHDGLDEEA